MLAPAAGADRVARGTRGAADYHSRAGTDRASAVNARRTSAAATGADRGAADGGFVGGFGGGGTTGEASAAGHKKITPEQAVATRAWIEENYDKWGDATITARLSELNINTPQAKRQLGCVRQLRGDVATRASGASSSARKGEYKKQVLAALGTIVSTTPRPRWRLLSPSSRFRRNCGPSFRSFASWRRGGGHGACGGERDARGGGCGRDAGGGGHGACDEGRDARGGGCGRGACSRGRGARGGGQGGVGLT